MTYCSIAFTALVAALLSEGFAVTAKIETEKENKGATNAAATAAHSCKPFVKWAGGKSQLIEQLSALLPKDLRDRKELTYVEPFVGGGAMLFYMLTNYPNIKRACFNGLYRVNAKGRFNVPFGKAVNPLICDAATIRADSAVLRKVEIICGDFEAVEPAIKGKAFFYFDPPYRPLTATAAFTAYSKDGFGDDQQEIMV